MKRLKGFYLPPPRLFAFGEAAAWGFGTCRGFSRSCYGVLNSCYGALRSCFRGFEKLQWKSVAGVLKSCREVLCCSGGFERLSHGV
jgi:hypothetical protein